MYVVMAILSFFCMRLQSRLAFSVVWKMTIDGEVGGILGVQYLLSQITVTAVPR